jgi:hypothetical protein
VALSYQGTNTLLPEIKKAPLQGLFKIIFIYITDNQ